MKKLLLISFALLCTVRAWSQVLYLQTFDGIPGPTAGGAGTYTFPPDMLLRNVDNLTPAGAVSYVNEAWERREDFAQDVTDSCAFSTSWYNPAGTSNDWMWTPGITLPAFGSIELTWEAKAYDPLYPDGYEVRIMTVPPTGGTGVLGNQIANSTVLFSTPAENTSWVTRTVNLNAYFGQTVYIGFRNNSSDQFILLIDDIKVEALNPYDAGVTAGQTYEYTQTPLSQASISLGGTISNVGSNALTNVNLHADIYNSANTLVYSGSSTAVPSIVAAGNAVFAMTPYTALMADIYTIKYYHTQTETDPNTGNDTLTQTITISDQVFARDNGLITGNLGIGAGNGGYLGQSFTLTAPAYLYSITTQYNAGYLNENYASVIWNTDGAGVPTTILASTDTLQYPNTNPLLATVPISGGTIFLPAGTYVVTAIEFDSTISLAMTSDIFTAGKMWVNWPTTPFGGWANVEAFGAAFASPYFLRMNLGSTLIPLASEALVLKGKAGADANELTWTNNEDADGEYTYTLENSADLKTWRAVTTVTSGGKKEMKSFTYTDRNNISAKNYYRINVSDKDNKLKYSNMVTLLNTGKGTLVEIYPNPAKTEFTVNTNNYKNVMLSLYDIQGKVVLSRELTEAVTGISLKGIGTGVYQVRLSNANEMIYAEKLVIE